MKKGFGELLKKAREAKKLSYADVYKELKIDRIYLQAMEDEDLTVFEKPIYLKLFTKTYATYLKADLAEVLRLLNEMPEIQALKKEKKKDAIHDFKQEIVKEEPSREIEETKSRPLGVINKTTMIWGAAGLGAVLLIVIIMLLLKPGKAGNVAEDGKNIYVAPQQQLLKVSAKAKSDVWMKARYDGTEEDFFIKAGEEKRWKDVSKIVFLIGNAAGVEFIVNGDSIGTIGEEGEVINGLVFETGKNWYIDRGQGFKRENKPAEPATGTTQPAAETQEPAAGAAAPAAAPAGAGAAPAEDTAGSGGPQ